MNELFFGLQADRINESIGSFTVLKYLFDAVLSRSSSICKMYHTLGIAQFSNMFTCCFFLLLRTTSICLPVVIIIMLSRFAQIEAASEE